MPVPGPPGPPGPPGLPGPPGISIVGPKGEPGGAYFGEPTFNARPGIITIFDFIFSFLYKFIMLMLTIRTQK